MSINNILISTCSVLFSSLPASGQEATCVTVQNCWAGTTCIQYVYSDNRTFYGLFGETACTEENYKEIFAQFNKDIGIPACQGADMNLYNDSQGPCPDDEEKKIKSKGDKHKLN